MKKEIIAALLTFVMLTVFMPQPVSAYTDELVSKHTYYTEESDYISGDCILTATRMMIRRAAIMNSRDEWNQITNETLRPSATVDGCLLSSFTFESEGLSYEVGYGEFKGESDSSRIAEFEELLKAHPEGFVAHGDWAASTGMHGVLVVKVEDGVVYAVDSSYNMGMYNEGIQKWKDTTMLEPSLCTRYWYICDIEKDGWKPELGIDKRMYFNLLRCA